MDGRAPHTDAHPKMTHITQTIHNHAPVERTSLDARLNTRHPSTGQTPDVVTRTASSQTFHTIQWLVDRERRPNAFRAYAYFRWLDDALDASGMSTQDRLTILRRQTELVERAFRGDRVTADCPPEHWLMDLVGSEPDRSSGLDHYVRHLMAVMAFDTERLGRPISAEELRSYSQNLAVGVTEAMHYFIGHDRPAPRRADRYQAVFGAHITHMLRDMIDDVRSGYYNIPSEYLAANRIAVDAFDTAPYRAWVRERVKKARDCFDAGSRYLAAVPCLRCRFAGFAYMGRFVNVLDTIEADGYVLREHYAEPTSLAASLGLVARALRPTLRLAPMSARA